MSSVSQRILKEFKLLRLKVNAMGARAEGVATNSKNGTEVLYGAPPHSTPTQPPLFSGQILLEYEQKLI
jgi:hypothetical protein